MSNTLKNKMSKAVNLLLAAVLAFGICMPAISFSPTPAYADEGGEVLDINAYVADNLDESLVPEGQGPQEEPSFFERLFQRIFGSSDETVPLGESGHYMYVSYLMVAEDEIDEGETIDSVWYEKQGSPVVAQYSTTAALYETDSDYLVAFTGNTNFTNDQKALDWTFTELNLNGEIIDGPVYDSETGICYVPKSLFVDEAGEEIYHAIHQQMMVPYDLSNLTEAKVNVEIDNHVSSVTAVAQVQDIEVNALDVTFDIPVATPDTAANISLENIALELNDDSWSIKANLADGKDAVYDAETGILTIAASAINTSKVKVILEEKALINKLIDPEKAYAASASSLRTIPFYKFTDLDVSALKVGDSFAYDGWFAYRSWYAKAEQVINATAPYGYSYHGNVEYNVLGEGKITSLIDWVVNGDKYSGGAWIDAQKVLNTAYANGNLAGNYTTATVGFLVSLPHGNIGGNNWDFTTSGTSWSSSWNGVAAACAHASQDIGNNYTYEVVEEGGQSWFRSKNHARVVALGDDYIVLAVCSAVADAGIFGTGQACTALYKFAVDAKGWIQIEKQSANSSITTNNDCYSLEGAEYAVYASKADAEADKNRIESYWGDATSLTTAYDEESGTYKTGWFEGKKGTYYVKEVTPSKGYALDPEIYEAEVTSSKTTPIISKEQPLNDPNGASVQKKDAETGKASAQGAGTLEGAQFTYKYYAGYYDSLDDLPDRATRTWVMKTDSDGTTDLLEMFKASGDNFYKDSLGTNVVLPLGTLTIQETKAPSGYLLPEEPTIFLAQIVEDENAPNGASVKAINYDGKVFELNDASDEMLIETNEQPIKGGVKVKKIDHDTNGDAQGDGTLKGAVFQIVNIADGEVFFEGKTYKKNDVVPVVLVTGEDGTATTANDVLSAGKYRITEVTAPDGYNLNTKWSATFEIVENHKIVDITDNPVDDEIVKGGVQVHKIDRQLDAAQGNSTLKGAEFGIKLVKAKNDTVKVDGKAYAEGEQVKTITTDENGFAATDNNCLPAASYVMYETKAPAGYLLNEDWTFEFTISEQGEMKDAGEADDQVMRGGVELYKVDVDFDALAQGDSTLAGAEFTVYNQSKAAVVGDNSDPIKGEPVGILVTDEAGVATSATDWLAYGNYVAYETKAPKGYLLNEDWKFEFSIISDGQMVKADTKCANEPIRGRVIIGKMDRENETYTAQGAGTLEGATIDIYNMSASKVKVNGEVFEAQDARPVLTLTTKLVDGKVIIDSGERVLPEGTYKAIESTTSSKGYRYDNESKAWSQTFSIRTDGETIDLTDVEHAVKNHVIRADASFVKLMEGSNRVLSNIPFKITSQTTGEWHIIVTDPNGEAGTAFAPHTANTNANDAALREDGTIDESLLSYENGVWFNGSVDVATLDVDDNDGALVYDGYDVDELMVKANEGFEMVHTSFTVYRDKDITGRTFIDKEGPSIGTSLRSNDEQSVMIDEHATFVDTVDYQNLTRGETYTMKAALHAFDTDGKDLGVIATAEKEFKANRTLGSVKVVFEDVNTLSLANKSVVCFEQCLDATGKVVTKHEDPNDEEQTVKITPDVPAIEKYINKDVHQDVFKSDTFTYDVMAYVTKDADTITVTDALVENLDFASSAEEVVVADAGLENNHYTNGSYSFAHSEATVTAEAEAIDAQVSIEGKTLTVVIEDAKALRGHWVKVTFDAKIAKDADYTLIEDNGPVLSDESHIGIPNQASYTIGVGDNPDAYGKHESNIVTVRPEEPEIEKYINKDVHQDLDVADETFTYDIMAWVTHNATATTITDELVENLKFVSSAEEVAVYDMGAENNHKTDGAYTAKADDATVSAEGTLIDDAQITIADKQLRVHIADATAYRGHWLRVSFVAQVALDGNYVTISGDTEEDRLAPNKGNDPVVSDKGHSGIPNKASYTIDTKDKPNAYSDVSNTVTVKPPVPEIGTVATDKITNTHYIEASETSVVVDTVNYTNLVPGGSYTLRGWLVDANGQATSEAVVKDFVANEVNGSVIIEIPIDTSKLAGTSHVAFEELYLGVVAEFDGENTPKPISEHKDPKDEEQTVHVIKIGTRATDKTSGTHYVEAGKDTIVVDEVSYEGLVPGTTYTLFGQLIDTLDGRVVTDVVAHVFTPSEASGVETIEIPIDTSTLNGSTFVAFEELHLGSVDKPDGKTPIASHKDPKDEEQTVRIIKIGTDAKGTVDNYIFVGPEQTITDTVSYEGLVPGKTYTVSGVLMVKESGKNLEIAGKSVTASAEFVAEAANGTVEVVFELDASELRAGDLVVFEELYLGSKKETIEIESPDVPRPTPIAQHKDIGDDAQTIHVPAIKTSAKSANGNEVANTTKQKIVDTITYTNLEPGKAYTAIGTLMYKSGDKGEALTVKDKPVTAFATFTPKEANGTVEVTFEFDGTNLKEGSLVVFEDLYLGELKDGVPGDGDTPIAKHADINDKDQTVPIKINKPTTDTPGTDSPIGRFFDKTGNVLAQYWWVVAALLVVAGGAAGYTVYARRKAGGMR